MVNEPHVPLLIAICILVFLIGVLIRYQRSLKREIVDMKRRLGAPPTTPTPPPRPRPHHTPFLRIGDEVEIDLGSGVKTRGVIYDFIEDDFESLMVACRLVGFVHVDGASDEQRAKGGWWYARPEAVTFASRPSSPLPAYVLSDDALEFIKTHSEECPDVEDGELEAADVAEFLQDLFQTHAESAVMEDRKKSQS